jgi:hypothetical protein
MGANQQTSVPAFTAGQVLTAQQQTEINTGVPVFADTTARDAAFGGTGEKTLAEGQLCYIEAAPKRVQVYNGTAWIDYDAAATSFTPTWTNYTRGNGVTSAYYLRLGKFVFVSIIETLGSTSSITGSVSVTLPIATARVGSVGMTGLYRDAGVNAYLAMADITSSTTVMGLYAANASGTYTSITAVSATVPFTWGLNDNFYLSFSYEAA